MSFHRSMSHVNLCFGFLYRYHHLFNRFCIFICNSYVVSFYLYVILSSCFLFDSFLPPFILLFRSYFLFSYFLCASSPSPFLHCSKHRVCRSPLFSISFLILSFILFSFYRLSSSSSTISFFIFVFFLFSSAFFLSSFYSHIFMIYFFLFSFRYLLFLFLFPLLSLLFFSISFYPYFLHLLSYSAFLI